MTRTGDVLYNKPSRTAGLSLADGSNNAFARTVLPFCLRVWPGVMRATARLTRELSSRQVVILSGAKDLQLLFSRTPRSGANSLLLSLKKNPSSQSPSHTGPVNATIGSQRN
jgi:hypothetical protein